MSYAGDVGAIFRYVTHHLGKNSLGKKKGGGKNNTRGHGGRLGALKPPRLEYF